jgi:hypothetical protein
MLTLEVYGKYITWPEEFAVLMMGHYKNHGVPFSVHRNCVHSGWSARAENALPAVSAGKTEDQAFPCRCK